MATKLPENRAESVFADYKPAYQTPQALAEANRCLYCQDAPCIGACPTGINIPEFIRKIATGNLRGSARTIFDSNILGMSCARVCPVEVLCVGDCVYNRMDQPPIQIGKLQRYATDLAFESGWQFYEAGPDSGKKVALIGAGPASLACAHRLRRFGHACTIFEKRDVIGGLNAFGVAPYKMKADRAIEEAEWVLGIGGIEVKTGIEVGVDVSFSQLERDYDAVFVGIGLGPDRHLGVPGEELEGVYGAVDFIEAIKLEPASFEGVRRAVVVGGGNTAVDCVREAIGLGLGEVTMVYRGTEAKMSGYAHEWKAAKIDGARAIWRRHPIAYEGDGGRVTGVRVAVLDDDKQPIPGREELIGADLVLVAVGQSRLLDLLKLDGVRMDSRRILTDADGATGRPGVFAGGDLANGAKEVVNAVAEGRDAAVAIHAYLTEA
ncbi:MAG: glutamate synthase [Deltaproteobacteria bacterium HGW-Deltaproteobacteria-14]|jgi:glutamate synthase (NADPH/NADH) small chain|nr:MAG: glutamate synthase [Deltaproteobacteria bacterium HGW-Deltaproteobacteria-14]